MTIYTGHSVLVQPDGVGSPTLIGALTNVDADIDSNISAEVTAGSPYALNTTINSQKPKITFSSRDLKKVIDLAGLIGLTITGATNPGVQLWQALLENGVIKSGSFHRNIRMPNGRLVVRKISVNHQDDAQIDCEAIALYDGTNLPFIPSASNLALPGTPADPARHTLHSITFGGATIPCIVSLDIDFGNSIESFGCESDIYDTHLQVAEIKPMITIRALRPAVFATSGGVPLAGLVGTHANTVIKLRKRSQGVAGFVADATAEHISITTAGTLLVDKAFTANGNKRGEIGYKIQSRFDGTNAPFIFNTATAL